MIQIERIRAGAHGKKSKYQIVSVGKDRNIIATIDSLEKAACVLRFIHGSNIKGAEYILAVETMREIDRDEADHLAAKYGAITGTEGTNERTDEIVSGKANNGIFDGNTTD